jgi:3-oxoacyl-[acyl-carrier protein] reductase
MNYVVFGCSSGFGRAIAQRLLNQGHTVHGFSRTEPDLKHKQLYWAACDVTQPDAAADSVTTILQSGTKLHGLVLNAGGPPTGTAAETHISAYRNAYSLVFEWKASACLAALPHFRKQKFGRILFIESQSVKQPIPGLVLSNTFRLAVTGFAKSLALEIASEGITLNILAPGSHDTPAIRRVIEHHAASENITPEKARSQMEKSIPAGRMGKPGELASLACWLLGEDSSYVTGQVISHDGGNIRHTFG